MKKISITIILSASLFILTGCGTSNENEDISPESSVSQSEETVDSSSKNSKEESSSTSSQAVINSEEEAFDFIKEELEIEPDNTDIVYNLLDSDEDSYTLRLVSQSMQEQGGSGTVGLYKIYTDGTYEEQPN